MMKINPVPHSINNVDLEEKVCEALPLTGTKVKQDDLDACHRMKKKDKVIIKFKKRKQRNDMIFKRKELKSLLMIFLHSSLVDCCLLPTACVSKTRFSFINADS